MKDESTVVIKLLKVRKIGILTRAMSLPAVRSSARWLRVLRRTLRVSAVPVCRAGCAGGWGAGSGRTGPPPRHYTVGAGTLALALLAADHVYNGNRKVLN